MRGVLLVVVISLIGGASSVNGDSLVGRILCVGEVSEFSVVATLGELLELGVTGNEVVV